MCGVRGDFVIQNAHIFLTMKSKIMTVSACPFFVNNIQMDIAMYILYEAVHKLSLCKCLQVSFTVAQETEREVSAELRSRREACSVLRHWGTREDHPAGSTEDDAFASQAWRAAMSDLPSLAVVCVCVCTHMCAYVVPRDSRAGLLLGSSSYPPMETSVPSKTEQELHPADGMRQGPWTEGRRLMKREGQEGEMEREADRDRRETGGRQEAERERNRRER